MHPWRVACLWNSLSCTAISDGELPLTSRAGNRKLNSFLDRDGATCIKFHSKMTHSMPISFGLITQTSKLPSRNHFGHFSTPMTPHELFFRSEPHAAGLAYVYESPRDMFAGIRCLTQKALSPRVRNWSHTIRTSSAEGGRISSRV